MAFSLLLGELHGLDNRDIESRIADKTRLRKALGLRTASAVPVRDGEAYDLDVPYRPESWLKVAALHYWEEPSSFGVKHLRHACPPGKVRADKVRAGHDA